VTQLVEKADRRTAWEFLQHMLEVVPYQVHTILTDNGIQFAEQPRNRNTIYSRPMRFDMICEANGVVSDEFEPVSAMPVVLSIMPSKDPATRREQRRGSA
jgi:hypothetical protein